jgi:hypothetical protein
MQFPPGLPPLPCTWLTLGYVLKIFALCSQLRKNVFVATTAIRVKPRAYNADGTIDRKMSANPIGKEEGVSNTL